MYIGKRPEKGFLDTSGAGGGGGGGQLPSKKNYPAANVDGSGILGWFSGNLALGTLTLAAYFQVFRPEHPQTLKLGQTNPKQGITHPQNRGIPCFQPLGPTFVDLKPSVVQHVS